jgi:hypothetical protein
MRVLTILAYALCMLGVQMLEAAETYDYTWQWDHPTHNEMCYPIIQKVDIKGYVIRYGPDKKVKNTVTVGFVNEHTFKDIPYRPMYARIATISSSGERGDFSKVMSSMGRINDPPNFRGDD